jgi:hypothetical protein
MWAMSARAAARRYLRYGINPFPIHFTKLPHPKPLSEAFGQINLVGYKDDVPVYTGYWRMAVYDRMINDKEFDILFPPTFHDYWWVYITKRSRTYFRFRGGGVAVATGRYNPSIAIVDVDTRSRELAAEVADVLAAQGMYVVLTPHGGIHVYLCIEGGLPEELKSKSGMGGGIVNKDPRIEIKSGRGQYVVAPPTVCFCNSCKGMGKWSLAPGSTHSISPVSGHEAIRLVELIKMAVSHVNTRQHLYKVVKDVVE